jgi:sarcosine oxidase
MGVHYIEDDLVAIDKSGSRITGVQLRQHGKLTTGHLVNAAGAWAGDVSALAGIDLPVRVCHFLFDRPHSLWSNRSQGRKRCVFVFATNDPMPPTPLTIDPSGVYFRPEGRQFICGVSPAETADPDTYDTEVDWSLWESVIWPTLAARVPNFEAIRTTNAWAGLYDYNTFDHNGIIGAHPEIRNLLFANGFSGHGLQQSPAVGRAVAELITAGRYQSLDLTRMGIERLLERRPLLELNIV